MTGAFESKESDSPRLCAELLLAHVIGCERLRLYMEADRPANPLERETLRGLVTRALENEPVQYLVDEAWFFSLPMHADRRALIPRPSSETIVEHVLQHVRADPGLAPGGRLLIGDMCTGSGCIAIALAKHLHLARILATDISTDALELAAVNARRHKVGEQISFAQGDMFEPISKLAPGRELHILVVNPPYIPDHQWAEVAANVRNHEPELALRGGTDGLEFVGPIIKQAGDHLRAGGLLLVEIASSTAGAVLDLARARDDLEEPWIEDDFDGLPRVLVARRLA